MLSFCSFRRPPAKDFPIPLPNARFSYGYDFTFFGQSFLPEFPWAMRLAQVAGTKLSPFLQGVLPRLSRPLLTHVARGRGRREQQPKDAAFCFTRKAARQWVGFSGLAHRPRIITDQISDISRGMNVLWCVFYFISLSYNPPSNGTRFSLPPPRRVVLAGSVGGVVLDGVVLCAWPPPNGGARENVECEIKKTWQ